MGSWIFKTRGQGEVPARDINSGVINIDIAFKARSLEISKGVSAGREKRNPGTEPV